MGGYPTGPATCAPPECEPRVTSLADPGPVAVFVFWGFVVGYLASYFLVKFLFAHRNYVPSARLELTTPSHGPSVPTAKSDPQVTCEVTAALVCADMPAAAQAVALCSLEPFTTVFVSAEVQAASAKIGAHQDTRMAVNLEGRYLLVTGYKNSLPGLVSHVSLRAPRL